MPVRLKGTSGYYAKDVDFEGSHFKVRELDDTELTAYLGAVDALKAQLNVQGDMRHPAEFMAEVDALGFKMDAEQTLSVVHNAQAAMQAALIPGLVSWDIPNHDCTPENVVLLPNRVQERLSREIIDATVLSPEEQGFSTPSGRR